MSKCTEAVELAVRWADDPSHGYDQDRRWGPDYDCSSFLSQIWTEVGVNVKGYGASWTGNMRSAFLKAGFVDVTALVDLSTGTGLFPGDVLLNESYHTEMYIGNGRLVGASINELGTVRGGQTGDQTGREIRVCPYYVYSHGWDCVLRFMGEEEYTDTPTAADAPTEPTAAAESAESDTYTVRPGDSWWSVAEKKLGGGWYMSSLAELNGRTLDSILYPGEVLRLRPAASTPEAAPAPAVTEDGTYTVKPGDTLSGICQRELGNAMLYREVAELNGIVDPNLIYPGQVIRLWDGSCASCTFETV